MFSCTVLFFENFVFIDKKDKILLVIKSKAQIETASSIIVFCCMFSRRKEVSTIKQSPNKLEDVLSMCGDLLSGLLSSMGDKVLLYQM